MILCMLAGSYARALAQEQIIIFEADPRADSSGMHGLYHFIYVPGNSSPDSFRVSYYSTKLSREVRSYRLVYDTSLKQVMPADSVICECYPAKVPGDELQVSLYRSGDTLPQALASFIYRVPGAASGKPSAGKAGISGMFRSESYLSDAAFDYQLTPLNYTRNTLELRIEIGGLPFKAGFFYSSESSAINSYYLSFDYARYRSNLLTRLAMKQQAALASMPELNPGLLDVQIRERVNEISSPEYAERLRLSKRELIYGEGDSVFRRTQRYKTARSFIWADSLRRADIYRLDSLKRVALNPPVIRNQEWMKRELLADDAKLKNHMSNAGVTAPGFGFLSALRRFDLGTFTPVYNMLSLGAIQVNGVNIELGKGLAYAAVCVGEARTGLITIGGESRYEATLLAARAGLRSDRRFSLIFTGLKANGRSPYYSPARPGLHISGQVYGVEGSYVLFKQLELKAELASSITATAESARAGETFLLENRTKPAFSAAGLVNMTYRSASGKTEAQVGLQQTGPGYFSMAAPYLRRDNRRSELRMNQRVLKTLLTVFGSLRLEQDNLFGTKEGTTHTTIVTGGTRIAPPGWPFVTLSWSPVWQRTVLPGSKTLQNRMNMYNASAGYTRAGKKMTAMLVLNYVRNNSDLLAYDLSRQYIAVNTFMLNHSLVHHATGITLISGLNMMNQLVSLGIADSTLNLNMRSAEIGILKKMELINGAVDAGYIYIEALPVQHRHGIKAGLSTSVSGFMISFRAEKYFITRERERSALHLCRITLIKPF